MIDQIAAWWNLSIEITGFILGLVFLVLIILGVSLVSDSPMVFMFIGLASIIFFVLLGLWPIWTLLPIVLALAVMFLYGGNANASSQGRGG